MRPTTAELARRVISLERPADALPAVAALRRRLDELEALHVENARRSGMPWQQLADAVGVSKQALHRKHAERLRAHAKRRGTRGSGGPAQLIVTGEARDAVYFGRQEARALGHELVGTGHLLLGLLRHANGRAAFALRSLNVSLGALRGHVDRLISVQRTTPAPGSTAEADGRLPVSQAARRVLEQSLHEAVGLGDGHLGVEHILLALLREPDAVAGRALAALGVTAKQVEEQLVASRNVRAGA